MADPGRKRLPQKRQSSCGILPQKSPGLNAQWEWDVGYGRGEGRECAYICARVRARRHGVAGVKAERGRENGKNKGFQERKKSDPTLPGFCRQDKRGDTRRKQGTLLHHSLAERRRTKPVSHGVTGEAASWRRSGRCGEFLFSCIQTSHERSSSVWRCSPHSAVVEKFENLSKLFN